MKKSILLKSSFVVLAASSVLSIIPLINTSCSKGDSHDYSKGVSLINVKEGDDVGGFDLVFNKTVGFTNEFTGEGNLTLTFITFTMDYDFAYLASTGGANWSERTNELPTPIVDSNGTWNYGSSIALPSDLVVLNIDWSVISASYPLFYSFCKAQTIKIHTT